MDEFFEWLKKLKQESFADFHCPTVATINEDGSVNLVVKNVEFYEVNGTYLIGLEISGTKTFENLSRRGSCDLLFVHRMARESYQVHCSVAILDEENEIFKKTVAMHDRAHGLTEFVCGYLFEVTEVFDKSLRRKKETS